jgi:5-methylcytosine-specific restriction protein A
MAAPIKQQRAEPPWRRWYKLARWRRLRLRSSARRLHVQADRRHACDGVYPAQ